METLSQDEIREMKRRRIASMTDKERADMLNEACERAHRRDNDEFIRQTLEPYKQSEQYKERLKRKEAQKNELNVT